MAELTEAEMKVLDAVDVHQPYARAWLRKDMHSIFDDLARRGYIETRIGYYPSEKGRKIINARDQAEATT